MTDVWDTEAKLLASANGLTLNECREAVILKWMEEGDLRPLRAALLRGDMLGRVIQQYLGAMLLDNNDEFCFIDEQTGRKTSHQLIVRKRGTWACAQARKLRSRSRIVGWGSNSHKTRPIC